VSFLFAASVFWAFPGAAFARVPDTTVTYARIDTTELKLDLFLVGRRAGMGQPEISAPAIAPVSIPPLIRRPLIVWVHGGGWRGGSRADFSPAWTWVDSGYSVASIDYRLSHSKKWPAQIHDVKAAVRWLRANADAFALDTARFVVWGASAGAHLAAMEGLTGPADALEGPVGAYSSGAADSAALAPSSGSLNGHVNHQVKGVIDFYGASDFLEPNPKRWAPWSSVGELLGCGVRQCMDHARWASPVQYVNRGDVPFLILHGTLDTLVPITQAIRLDSALRAAQVPVEFHKVVDGHGGPTFVSDSANVWVGGFLRRVLGPVLPAPVAPALSAPAAPPPEGVPVAVPDSGGPRKPSP